MAKRTAKDSYTPPLSKELEKLEEDDAQYCAHLVECADELISFFRTLNENAKLPDYMTLCDDSSTGCTITLCNYRNGVRYTLISGIPTTKGGMPPTTFRMEPISVNLRYVKPVHLAMGITIDTHFMCYLDDKSFWAPLKYLPDELARWRRHMRLQRRFAVEELATRVVDQFEMVCDRLTNK